MPAVPGTPLGPFRTWRGRVLLAEPGREPGVLADAPLQLLYRGDLDSEPEVLVELRTGADGSFAIQSPLRVGWQALAVAADGLRVPVATVVHSERLLEGRLPDAAPLELGDCAVKAAGSLQIEAVDAADGRPVREGALVGASIRHLSAYDPEVLFGLLDGGRWALAETDVGGRATFPRLPPGRVEFVVRDEQHRPGWGVAEIVSGGATVHRRLELKPGHGLRGVVLDSEGQPVAGAEVSLMGFGHRNHDLGAARTRTTDADGRFAWTDLEEGDVELYVAAAGHPTWQGTYPTGSRLRKVWLPAAREVEVRVFGIPEGVEVERVGLEFEEVDDDVRGFVFHPARSALRSLRPTLDADGVFRYPLAIAGRYRVRASAGAAGGTEWRSFEVGEEDVAVELRFGVRFLDSFELRAVDETGAPLEGALVRWISGTGSYLASDPVRAAAVMDRVLEKASEQQVTGSAVTDPFGSCRVVVSPGEHAGVVVSMPGRMPVVPQMPSKGADGLENPLQVVLPRAGSIRCAVRGAVDGTVDGTVDGGRLVDELLLFADDVQVASAVPAEDGSWRFDPVLPGRYRIVLSRTALSLYDRSDAVQAAEVVGVLGAGRDQEQGREVRVRPGEVTDVELAFPDTGSLRGRVLRGGVPVAGVEVFSMVATESEGYVVPGHRMRLGLGSEVHGEEPPIGAPVSVSDSAGRYRFRVVGGGERTLWVRHRESTVASGPFVVVLRPGTEQVLDLTLGGGSVRGRLAPAIRRDPGARGRDTAWLLPESEASRDIFASDFHGLPLSAGLASRDVDERGAFRFGFVPPGRFVLRVQGQKTAGLLQVPVVVGVDEDVDLGELTLEPVEVQLLADFGLGSEVGDDESRSYFGAVRWRVPGFDCAVPVRTASFGRGQRVTLLPGTYEVELMVRDSEDGFPSEESVGRFAAFEVQEGGRVVPEVLRFEER